MLHADGGIINLVDWDRRVDEVVAVAGIAPPVVGERISLEDSLSGWVTLHNQATISNDVQKDDRVARSIRSWAVEEHIQSVAAAPLIVRDQVKGTLVVIGRKEGKEKFVQVDLDLLDPLPIRRLLRLRMRFFSNNPGSLPVSKSAGGRSWRPC